MVSLAVRVTLDKRNNALSYYVHCEPNNISNHSETVMNLYRLSIDVLLKHCKFADIVGRKSEVATSLADCFGRGVNLISWHTIHATLAL